MAQTNYPSGSNYTPYTFGRLNVWGLAPMGSQDGSAQGAGFFHPAAVVTDSHGNTFVADTENSTIRMITADGRDGYRPLRARPACSGAATAPEPPPVSTIRQAWALTRRTTFMCRLRE